MAQGIRGSLDPILQGLLAVVGFPYHLYVGLLAQVQVGNLVKAKGALQNDGSILAEEVELEDEGN
jgi:hypothetical protein